MKHYFYAPSFVTLREYIYLRTLYPDLVMVTSHPDLVEVAKLMKWDCVAFLIQENEGGGTKSSTARKLSTWQHFSNVRSEIDRVLLPQIQDGIYFSTCLYVDLWGIRILKQVARLKKSVEVVYLNDHEVTRRFKIVRKTSLERRLLRIKASTLYGVKVQWYDTGVGQYLGVDVDEFTSRYGIENRKDVDIFYSKVDYGIIDVDMEPVGCLILGGYSIDDSKDLLSTESKRKVFSFIKKVRGNAYHKYHPGGIARDELSDSFKQVPPALPVEMLHQKIKMAVGDFSTALTTLSCMGVKCISYLNLLETYPSFDKAFWIDRMTKNSGGRIIFVNTFEELGRYIRES